jgi:hypothetical protein
MTKLYAEEDHYGEQLNWSIEKMRDIAKDAAEIRMPGTGSRTITVKRIAARRNGKIPSVVVYYFDQTTQRDWTKSASLYSDEGLFIVNNIEIGKTYQFTSERQKNGYWVWVQLEEVQS